MPVTVQHSSGAFPKLHLRTVIFFSWYMWVWKSSWQEWRTSLRKTLLSLYLVPSIFWQLTWGSSAESHLSQQRNRWRATTALFVKYVEKLVLCLLPTGVTKQKSSQICSLKMVSEKWCECLCHPHSRMDLLAHNHSVYYVTKYHPLWLAATFCSLPQETEWGASIHLFCLLSQPTGSVLPVQHVPRNHWWRIALPY